MVFIELWEICYGSKATKRLSSGDFGQSPTQMFLLFQENDPLAEWSFAEIRANLSKGYPEKKGVCIHSSVTCIERFGDMVETILHSQCGSSTNVKKHACTYITNCCKMLISQKRGFWIATVQFFASAIVTEPSPNKEKQRTPSLLNGLENDIMTDPQKIDIMYLRDVIVIEVSFEF